MNSKERTKCIVITIVLSIVCLIPLFEHRSHKNKEPESLYRVYLNGRSIGSIKSKETLEK